MDAVQLDKDHVIRDLPGQQLGRVVQDLQTTVPIPGLWRYFSSISIMFVALALAYNLSLSDAGFYLFASVAGVFFAAAAVTTHDAIHHTLTGIAWFDEVSARVATWGVLWPHGTYSELHKLHHKMNGVDLRDPERVTYTEAEYNAAGAVRKFMIRHQLLIAVFVSGGIGMILGHLFRARSFLKQSKALRRQLALDIIAILSINGLLYGLAAANGQLTKAVVLYLIVERIGGGLLQLRAHVEHYGLGGKRDNYFSTQLHACRNIETNPVMSWLFNGLNFHSIHHAFPKVPFYHLEEAHHRMTATLIKEGAQQMPQTKGYIDTFRSLSKVMRLLPDSNR